MILFNYLTKASIAGLLLLIIGLVLVNSGIVIPAGSWFIASLLGAAAILVGGEILIKKLVLTDMGAKATRFAFAFGAIVVALTGINSVMTGNLGVPGMPSWLQTGVTTLGWFGVISLGVIAATMVFGMYRYSKIPGNTSAYLFMATVGFFIFFGGIYLVGMMVAPDATALIIEAAANDARSAASGIVETAPNGVTSIKWEKFQGIEWGNLGGIALLCFLAFVFLKEYLGKNKIVVMVAAIVASLAFLMLSYHYATKWEVTNNIIQGAVELNPALGETRFVNLTTTADHRLVVANIGPNDFVRVHIPPKFCTVDWEVTPFWLQQYGNATWYDPTGHYLYKVSGGSSLTRTYAFTDAFKEGLKAAGANVALEFRANCQQP